MSLLKPGIRLAAWVAGIAGLTFLLSACHDSSSGGGGSAATSTFDFDTAKQWFDQLNAAIDAENLNPPEASRRIGYAGVAFYEAVVGGMKDHRSLVGQLNGLSALPE